MSNCKIAVEEFRKTNPGFNSQEPPMQDVAKILSTDDDIDEAAPVTNVPINKILKMPKEDVPAV